MHICPADCPTFQTAYKERCEVPAKQEWVTDYAIFQRVKHKWKQPQRLPDRP